MAVAQRAITRLQDADDVNVSLGAGVDEYTLTYDHNTQKFVLRAAAAGAGDVVGPAGAVDARIAIFDGLTGKLIKDGGKTIAELMGVSDHGALTGLTPDDDHTQYALLAGRTGGQTLVGGTAATDTLVLKATSGAGAAFTAGIQLCVGNNGSIAALKIDSSSGAVGILRDGYYLNTLGVNWDNDTSYRNGLAIYADNGSNHADAGYPFVIYSSGGTPRMYVDKDYNLYTAGGLTLGGGALSVSGAFPLAVATTYSFGAEAGVARTISFARKSATDNPANGAGCGLALNLESSTTDDVNAAAIDWLWNDATHATRKADLVLSAYDTAAREGLRIRGNGSAAALGFFGTAPAARPAGVAVTAEGIHAALVTLGLITA